ncbi:hypothetical protein [Streptomyces sp. UH6]|uniref:hypothetical protein n=1 Tax=Streptomyces sp. UH6 TaxID=2748379 RepID=UPI0015D48019|nr:hypothetical protein [Streptomyces sp. UH6]NYV74167.1 hypothetical protein [Streptomyces sp. UH6]
MTQRTADDRPGIARRTEARSRLDEKVTVIVVLAFGVLVAPTSFGQGVLDIVSQLTQSVTQSSSP